MDVVSEFITSFKTGTHNEAITGGVSYLNGNPQLSDPYG